MCFLIVEAGEKISVDFGQKGLVTLAFLHWIFFYA
jgi:hypothetical protein